MPIEQEDRAAAEAWGKVEPDTTQKTAAYTAGRAAAREKYQAEIESLKTIQKGHEALIKSLRQKELAVKLAEERAKVSGLAQELTDVCRDAERVEEQLAEERAHADRLAAALEHIVYTLDGKVAMRAYAGSALAAHRQRREGEE